MLLYRFFYAVIKRNNMKKQTFSLCALSMLTTLSVASSEYTYTFDSNLDGIDSKTHVGYIDLKVRGEIIFGTSPDGGVLAGGIEEVNNSHTGSGSTARFSFKSEENGRIKWLSGNVTNGVWQGTWYGSEGDKGDFSLTSPLNNNTAPTAADVIEFNADPIYSGSGRYDQHNLWNVDFLKSIYGVGEFAFAEIDQTRGILVQSDSGGLPFPMSFDLSFSNNFTLSSFRLGSINNGQGTRLTTFNLDIWQGGEWVTKGNFEFPNIAASRTFAIHEFQLPESITTSKVRISATGTSDHYNGGRVFMWGLSFNN